MSENGDVLLFSKFVQLAETRTNKNIQAWEKKKSNLLASLEQFYQHNCPNGDNELSKTVLAPLQQYHAKVKDGIKLLFDNICATHRNDIKAIQVATGRLAEDTKAHYLQRNSQNTEALEYQMEMLRVAENSSQDPSSTEPGATRIEEGKTKTNKSSPASAGLSFERAHNQELLGSSNHQSLTLSELLNQGEVLENKEFEGIHPVMGDLLKYGTLLNLEYEEGLITIDSKEPEWETEDEDGEGEGKEEWGEDQLPQQVEGLRSKLNRNKDLLVKAKSEIFELRRQKDDFWTACQFLLERKQESTEPNATAEESALTAVDITTTSFSPTTQSGNQTQTSGPDSTVVLPSMRDRFAKLLDSHRQRLEIAIKRCNDEQIDLKSKMSNARTSLDPHLFQPTRPGRMRSKSEVLLPVVMPSLISRAETFGSRFNSVDSAIAEDPEPDNPSNSEDDITESQDTSTPAAIQPDGSKSVVSSKAGGCLVKIGKSPDSPKKPDYSEEDDSSKRTSPEKSYSPKDEGSPRNVSPEKSGSPRKKDSPKKEVSSNEGDSQEKEIYSEDGEIQEKDDPPEKDDILDSNPPMTSKLSTPARGEGDDDPDYPEDDLTPREDQLVNIFRWLYHKLWVLLLNVLLYVASQFRAWARFLKFVYQTVAYPFRTANGSTTTFNLPRAQDVRLIASHVLLAMTIHLYLDLRQERNQWYDANGITRNMMLARIANPPSWSSLGVDRVLKLGGYFIYALWLPFYTLLVWLTSIPSGLWNIVDCMLHLLGVYQLPRFFRDLLWLLYELKDFLYCCYLSIRGDDGAGYCFSSLQSPGFKGILEEYRRLSKFF
ncbi:uncharacterized protein QYS62_010322 [Fusarium acuminatum]|uniref:Uncharacterized protein n=1 Tax=Fusarium acuminatum TaxID=5515 RepID=A0ABZ2X8Q5_9HYPO